MHLFLIIVIGMLFFILDSIDENFESNSKYNESFWGNFWTCNSPRYGVSQVLELSYFSSLIISKMLFKAAILLESSVNCFSVYVIISLWIQSEDILDDWFFPKLCLFNWIEVFYYCFLEFMKKHLHTPFCKGGNIVANGMVFER